MNPWRRRRAPLPDCRACGHTLGEHAGAPGYEGDGRCGECRYELQHGELPPDAPLCDRRYEPGA